VTAIASNLSQNLDCADGRLDMGEDEISARLFQNPDHESTSIAYTQVA